jgi:hypothetical protein
MKKRTPYLSIQDGKKRFGGLPIVFMGMQAVTEFSRRIRLAPSLCSFGAIDVATIGVVAGNLHRSPSAFLIGAIWRSTPQ